MTNSKDTNKKEIDYSLINVGPLYIPPQYLKPGFKYCLVSDKPGEIPSYQRLGYEIVIDENIKDSDKKPSQSSSFGAAHTIQSKCGQLLVLMAISDELHAKFEAYKRSQVEATERSLGQIDGIPEANQTGSITVGKPR